MELYQNHSTTPCLWFLCDRLQSRVWAPEEGKESPICDVGFLPDFENSPSMLQVQETKEIAGDSLVQTTVEKAEKPLFPKLVEVVSKKIHTSRNVQVQESDVFQMFQTSTETAPSPCPSPPPRVAMLLSTGSGTAAPPSASEQKMKRQNQRGFLPTTSCSLHVRNSKCMCSLSLSLWTATVCPFCITKRPPPGSRSP